MQERETRGRKGVRETGREGVTKLKVGGNETKVGNVRKGGALRGGLGKEEVTLGRSSFDLLTTSG